MNWRIFLSILLFAITTCAVAQTRPMLPNALQQGSIDSQFHYLSTLSRNQDADFKLIRRTNLEIVRKNALDTISKLQTAISNLESASSSSVTTITALQDSMQIVEADLHAERQKTDSISFLGIDFSKSSYHTLVWSLIIGFLVAFLATLFSFRKAKVDTDEYRKTVDQLQDELQTTKKRAMEKEQVLKRQLLDEQLKRNS